MIEFHEVKTESEIKALAKLAQDIWNAYWPPIIGQKQTNFMVEKFQSEAAVKAQIQNENYIYKIISENGVSLGYFAVAPKNKKVWGEDEIPLENYLFLSKLYIVSAERARGLGRAAFEDIKKTAQKMCLKNIYLTVNKNNVNTIAAYKKWGFETVETAETQIGSGFIMDDYIMRAPA